MQSPEIAGLIAGIFALVFALNPALLSSLSDGIQNFRDALLFGAPRPHHRRPRTLERPLWLAVLGVLLILLALLAIFDV